MGVEIERKFLVQGDSWRPGVSGIPLRQGYLTQGGDSGCTVRIRLAGDDAWLTIKGSTTGVSRPEFEYAIPAADAHGLLALCQEPPVEKIRYRLTHAGHTWEIDEFLGANAGLVVAEIELPHPEVRFDRPAWLGREVSADPRYFNAALAALPFTQWPETPEA